MRVVDCLVEYVCAAVAVMRGAVGVEGFVEHFWDFFLRMDYYK